MKHGITAYRKGCRCEVCRKAHNEKNRTYVWKHRKTAVKPATRFPTPEERARRTYFVGF